MDEVFGDVTPVRPSVAYFSMEICLEQAIPTYSGGLGVLAGDTLRSAADLGVPMVAVTLLHRRATSTSTSTPSGQQTETPVHWNPEAVLEPVDARATVTLEGREVQVRAWKYDVRGVHGHVVPVYLLDTMLPGELGVGPHPHRLPLRWRRALPALPGDRARDGRRGARPGARLS